MSFSKRIRTRDVRLRERNLFTWLQKTILSVIFLLSWLMRPKRSSQAFLAMNWESFKGPVLPQQISAVLLKTVRICCLFNLIIILSHPAGRSRFTFCWIFKKFVKFFFLFLLKLRLHILLWFCYNYCMVGFFFLFIGYILSRKISFMSDARPLTDQ